tara:strand:+ start:1324 stop:1437 length:114 start_codon:yes stop_codon:yes gene_type:complete
MNRVARRVGEDEEEDAEVGIGRGGVDVCVGGVLASDK